MGIENVHGHHTESLKHFNKTLKHIEDMCGISEIAKDTEPFFEIKTSHGEVNIISCKCRTPNINIRINVMAKYIIVAVCKQKQIPMIQNKLVSSFCVLFFNKCC